MPLTITPPVGIPKSALSFTTDGHFAVALDGLQVTVTSKLSPGATVVFGVVAVMLTPLVDMTWQPVVLHAMS